MNSENISRSMQRNNLTIGTVWKKLLWFFVPIAIGTFIQQLYNTVDGLVVSKFVGTEALASVGGSTSQIINLIIGIFVSITAGASVILAQLYGAGREEDVKSSLGNSITISIVAGIALGVFGYFMSPVLLKLYKTPDDTIDLSLQYLRIYFIGVPFIMLLNMESNALRALGDSSSPFIYMIVACVLNIILDLVFVLVFKLEVKGVAIATVLAQVVNAMLLTYKLITVDKYYRLKFKYLRFTSGFLGSMLKIGIPAGVQSMMYTISNTIVQIAINEMGTIAVASWAMTGKVDGLFWAMSNALGAAITAFIGQNVGAKRNDRVKQCVKQGTIMSLIFTIAISGIIMALAKPLLVIFTDDQAVRDMTFEMILYFVPFYFTWSLIEVITAVLRGAGDAIRPVIILGITICLFRIVWIYTVHAYFNTIASLSLVYVASWVFASIVFFIYYKKSDWRKRAGLVINSDNELR